MLRYLEEGFSGIKTFSGNVTCGFSRGIAYIHTHIHTYIHMHVHINIYRYKRYHETSNYISMRASHIFVPSPNRRIVQKELNRIAPIIAFVKGKRKVADACSVGTGRVFHIIPIIPTYIHIYIYILHIYIIHPYIYTYIHMYIHT